MSAYAIIIIAILMILFILLSLLPFMEPGEEDFDPDDLASRSADLPPAWVTIHRH
jgi:hypothetical protein